MSKIHITDLSGNLIGFIYQFLSPIDILNASLTCKKLNKGLEKDFLWETFAKKQFLFLPNEGDHFKKWKDYFKYLRDLNENIKNGISGVSFKCYPYRGHKEIITAIEYFNDPSNLSTIIVTGDKEGVLNTWEYIQDPDDEDEMIYSPLRIHLNGNKCEIKKIIKFNNEQNMLVCNSENEIFYFKFNLSRGNKNNEKFEMIFSHKFNCNLPFFQVEFDTLRDKIYACPNLNAKENVTDMSNKLYIYDKLENKESSILNDIEFLKRKLVAEIVQNRNLKENIIEYSQCFKSRVQEKTKIFVTTENEIIYYMNYDSVYGNLLAKYDLSLPNVVKIDKKTLMTRKFNIELNEIFNIMIVNLNEIAFLGMEKNDLVFTVYSQNLLSPLRKISIKRSLQNFSNINLLNVENDSFGFLFNGLEIYDICRINQKNMTILFRGKLGKNINLSNLNCIDADKLRIVSTCDSNLGITIFNRKNGQHWYNFLGGSLTVIPKSFKKHEMYNGFHILRTTRMSVLGVHGNLLREYKCNYKYN